MEKTTNPHSRKIENAKKYPGSKEITTSLLRILGKPIVKFIVKFTNITPNQITLFSFLLAILGSLFIFQGGYKNILIGSSLALIYMVFDCVDGEVARLRGLGSNLGLWLDSIIGFIVNPLLILSLSVGLKSTGSLILGLFAVLCYPMQYLIVFSYKFQSIGKKEKIEMPISHNLEFIRYLYGSALLFPLLFIGAILNKAILVLWFFAIFGNLFWIALIFLQYSNLKKAK